MTMVMVLTTAMMMMMIEDGDGALGVDDAERN